ncbi:MAG: protein translocase subunit SecD [Planctomycetota bacterium]|nr:protein translocase subunit SecD [Planctomycetota bacterium]
MSLFAQAAEEKSFTETSLFNALMLVVIALVALGVGLFKANALQMKEHGWKLAVILFSVLFSTYYVMKEWPPRFGVDLKGGVTFIVDLNLDNDPEKVVQKFMREDSDGDGKLSPQEWTDKAAFKQYDSDEDGLVTDEEIRSAARIAAKEEGRVRESVDNVIDQLKKRIDPAGIYEVELRALGEDQIEITIPDVDAAEAARIFERIKKAGLLQFRILVKPLDPEHQEIVTAAGAENVRDEVIIGEKVVARWVNVGRIDKKRADAMGRRNRPFRFTLPFSGQSMNCLIRNSATGKLVSDIPISPNGVLSSVEGSLFKGGFKSEQAQKRFAENQKLRAAFYADWWEENQVRQPGPDGVLYTEDDEVNPNAEMQILVVEPSLRENVEGQDLVASLVRQAIDKAGRPAVEFTLKRTGVSKFSRLTGNNINRALGMILDGELLSAPNINSKIYKNGIIEGDFTSKEVDDLISILKAGQLKTTLQSPDGGGDLIDSTMGQEMKDRGFYAIGVSFVLILIFLCFYYRIAGIVSCLALILNLLMILAIIMMLKQPLTLNGLAGLVLTVGMSVDANVLIFERIREELAKDATMRMAIRNGFQRATTTIVDANITTFITAFILYVIGNEQLKSFSVALMLGIILSMFTAIFCSRVLFDVLEKKRWLRSLGMTQLLTNTRMNFIGKRGAAFAVSSIFIVIGIAAIYSRGGTMLNHDLAGGSMARIVFSGSTPLTEVNAVLDKISEENEINGAPVVISAAEVTSPLYKTEESYYRIMSNWKSDGGESLADLLKKGFEGKLANYVVKVSDIKTTGQGGSGGTAGGGSANPGGGASVPSENDDAAVGGASSEGKSAEGESGEEPVSEPCGGELLDYLQEEPKKDEQKGESQKAETGEAKTGETNPQETKSDASPGGETPKSADPAGGEAKQSENAGAKKEEPSANDATGPGISQAPPQDPTAVPPVKQVDLNSGFQPGQAGTSSGSADPGKYKTTARIQFGLSLEGAGFKKKAASLRSDFEEAAKSLNFDNYTRNNIKIRDAQIGGEFLASDMNEETDVWEVELTTDQKDHGEKILQAMMEKYNGEVFLPQSKEVGERFAQKAWLRALAAMVASLIGIVAYIWIRFQRVSFGLAAVAALIHDVLVVLGAIAVSFWLKDYLGIILVEDFKISLAVIAALLTIIGYSLNDTIVVFDRIREVRGKNPELNGDMVNRSINQTLSRTILTSLTTFIVVIILYGAGGDAIHGFAFALVVGVIVGTYSSIFVASPVLLMLMKGKHEVEEEASEA